MSAVTVYLLLSKGQAIGQFGQSVKISIQCLSNFYSCIFTIAFTLTGCQLVHQRSQLELTNKADLVLHSLGVSDNVLNKLH